jgi:DNA-binding MltR family transcriptional regulator
MGTLSAADSDLAGLWSDHFDASIRTESTRAKVVLAACYLDELLGQLLRFVLKPVENGRDSLFEGAQAPLGTFSSKIDLAFRLGLIDEKVSKSLHFVRRIRNEFAHNLETCSFEASEIKNWNYELHLLNDVATPERRLTFSPGPVGDFEKSVSWLVYWLKHRIQTLPISCHHCGSEMDHRKNIHERTP